MEIFDYDNILLLPRKCRVESRSDCDTSVQFGPRRFKLPVVPANMKTVVDEPITEMLAREGYFYVMHRFDLDAIAYARSMRDKGLVIFLIESLDDEGYLSATLDEVLTDLPAELEVELDELQAALRMLQSIGFDSAPRSGADQHAGEGTPVRANESPIVCHCERITAAQIVDACTETLPAADLDGLRRRTRATNGRCQGFACLGAVVDLASRTTDTSMAHWLHTPEAPR